jgi:hypothetical protein
MRTRRGLEIRTDLPARSTSISKSQVQIQVQIQVQVQAESPPRGDRSPWGAARVHDGSVGFLYGKTPGISIGNSTRGFSFRFFIGLRFCDWSLPYWHVNSRIIFQPESYSDCNLFPPLFVGLVCCRETAPQWAPQPCFCLFSQPFPPFKFMVLLRGVVKVPSSSPLLVLETRASI